MEDERMVAVDRHELGQLLLLDLHVDERVAVVVEDPEEVVDADVDARRLQERVVVRVDLDAALREEAGDRRIGEDHGASLRATIPGPSWQSPLTSTAPSSGASGGRRTAAACAAAA